MHNYRATPKQSVCIKEGEALQQRQYCSIADDNGRLIALVTGAPGTLFT